MDKVLIKTKDLCKEYKNDEVVTKVLYEVNVEIEKGEFVAIMGPSGSVLVVSVIRFLFHALFVSRYNTTIAYAITPII